MPTLDTVKLAILGGITISFILLAWFAHAMWKDNQQLEKDKDTLTATIEDMKKNSEAIDKQLNLIRLDEANRANNLLNNIKKVEGSNETVNCPMPNFMRDAFSM